MKQNVSKLQIVISTLEMKYDEYIVKVSDHKEMTSFGFNKVKIKKPSRLYKNKKPNIAVPKCIEI